MGKDVETKLESLNEFTSQCDYWLSCMGVEYPLLNEKIKSLEELLRNINEEQA